MSRPEAGAKWREEARRLAAQTDEAAAAAVRAAIRPGLEP